jgi:hypothetical protein
MITVTKSAKKELDKFFRKRDSSPVRIILGGG